MTVSLVLVVAMTPTLAVSVLFPVTSVVSLATAVVQPAILLVTIPFDCSVIAVMIVIFTVSMGSPSETTVILSRLILKMVGTTVLGVVWFFIRVYLVWLSR